MTGISTPQAEQLAEQHVAAQAGSNAQIRSEGQIHFSASFLKIIACACMFIDHTGAVLYPDLIVLRVIGRFAFPIFAFLIAVGYENTRNWKRYASRLFIFALISQWPFVYAFDMPHYYNVFFTLTAALVGIHFSERWRSIAPVIILALICEWANTDWGLYGVILPYLFYTFRFDKRRLIISTITFTLAFDLLAYLSSLNPRSFMQAVWIILLIPITRYDGSKGVVSPIFRYAFYLFYPAHLLLLGWIDQFRPFM